MNAHRILSLLLQYPDAEILAARDEIAAAAAAVPDRSQREAIGRFLDWSAGRSASELERDYVETFDFAKRSSLHLTYHRHGDRRDRGMVLVRLKQRYAKAGLLLGDGELPDYLPVMLEFAALAPGPGAGILAEQREAIEIVRASLRDADSPYADLLEALCAGLPRLTAAQRAEVTRIAAEGPPAEEVGLEPFAPPELMPAPRRPQPVAATPAAGGDGR